MLRRPVKNFGHGKDAVGLSQFRSILLALIIVPVSIMTLVGTESHNVAALITSPAKSLHFELVWRFSLDPLSTELLKFNVIHLQNQAI